MFYLFIFCFTTLVFLYFDIMFDTIDVKIRTELNTFFSIKVEIQLILCNFLEFMRLVSLTKMREIFSCYIFSRDILQNVS